MIRRAAFAAALLIAAPAARPDDKPAGPPLPAMMWVATEATQSFYDQLKADPMFARINKDLVGSPIMLRVTHSLEVTSGGKASGITTGLLAAATLGIVPLVTNHDLVVEYEVLVNGNAVASYRYRKNFTYTKNLWTKDKYFGLGADGLAWVRGTLTEALAAMRTDPRLAALVEEYQFYFPSPAS